MENVTTVKFLFVLENMLKDMFQETLKEMCQRIEDHPEKQCFSIMFIDESNKTTLFYYGYTHPDSKELNKVGLDLNTILC